jgi:hypothetical protein
LQIFSFSSSRSTTMNLSDDRISELKAFIEVFIIFCGKAIPDRPLSTSAINSNLS